MLSVKASLLAEALGHQVAIMVLNGAHKDPFYRFSDQIEFYDVPANGPPHRYFVSYSKGIQRTVNKFQPDVISVCDDGLKGFFVPRLIKTKAKIIYERHVSKLIEANEKDGFLKSFINRTKWSLMERQAKSFDRFVVLTEGNKNEWPTLKNMVVIPNPLSFTTTTAAPVENKIVICVGKISYQKGQDLLLKSWEKVHTRFSDWQLHLYGKENRSFLATDQLKNNVYWFPPEKNILEKYREASVFVMASRFEGFGMVLTEAMECGLPCVSFDCNYGPSDIIKDGEDGFLVENGDTNQLAEKIMELMADENLRKQMGQKAKQNVKRYAADEVVKIWDKLFREVRAF